MDCVLFVPLRVMGASTGYCLLLSYIYSCYRELSYCTSVSHLPFLCILVDSFLPRVARSLNGCLFFFLSILGWSVSCLIQILYL